jgi:exonuclease SbcD
MGFRILHTSDWHLGARLMSKEREEEHQLFLNYLIEAVELNSVDLLIVAGDIFDTGAPSNSARRMYYSFLTKLINTCCKHVLIVGGNHDSPAMLDAPKEVLSVLDIHVVGSALSDEDGKILFENEVIPIYGKDDILQAVVAAVPFLRDRDIMKAVAGQEYSDKIAAMRDGIKEHYFILSEKLKEFPGVPHIATGHLYAQNTVLSDNASRQEGENDIHIGNLAQVDMSEFCQHFSYLALGHIHKPQVLGGKENVRYSGSPLKMSFSEVNDRKIMCLVDFEEAVLTSVSEIDIPAFRLIQRFKGDKEKVTSLIQNFENSKPLAAWGEIVFEDFSSSVEIDNIKLVAMEKGLEILKYSIQTPKRVVNESEVLASSKSLSELSENDIFEMRCRAENLDDLEFEELQRSFNELKSWIVEMGIK